ncbi:monovalent cation/H(+) antiporter subunit G [Streptomyces radiopugnans]|uniref:Multicomponent Na+:H+ antiporter subunit G n=1 Tax=Streptomyces radiopugnans TaxID=403935 RepID=A0A1H9AZC3_9ACTN|nr:monovalent cation/H(+) antiporter subunit G [Streptomyces radiopugnans]URN13673.1 monovalent cation/H(+) antiporter subunit G [Streptomyces radiopugnans]SEP81837.1 multicomponent Na+:H+ antiporter subunit G [Streptomyces radiopugnans]
MNGLVQTALEAATAVLLLCGAVFCLLGGVGLVRFPDTVTRLQAAAKAQNLGLLLILIGAALRVPLPYAGLLLLIAVFQLITVPVLGQIVGRIAYRTGAVERHTLTVDELAERLAPPDAPDAGESGGGRGRGT